MSSCVPLLVRGVPVESHHDSHVLLYSTTVPAPRGRHVLLYSTTVPAPRGRGRMLHYSTGLLDNIICAMIHHNTMYTRGAAARTFVRRGIEEVRPPSR